MFEKLFKAKGNESEEEGFEELMAMTKEEPESVEPVNEAYAVESVGSVIATESLMALCDPEFYKKIKKFEDVESDDIPDYIFKDLCHDIGKNILKTCRIEYKVNMVEGTVEFVAVKK